MHTLHVLLVPGNETQLQDDPTIVENLLSQDVSPWFDWYQIGGRWNGYFGQLFPSLNLTDPNVLPLKGYPVEVDKIFREVQLRQDNEFLKATAAVKGSTVTVVNDTEGHIMGFPVAKDPESAQRMTELNESTAREWQEILAAGSLRDLGQYHMMMALYHVERLTNLVYGKWCPDSGFYDFAAHTSRVDYAQELLQTASAENYSLVAVDFHF